jgi:predicted aspartyl protease
VPTYRSPSRDPRDLKLYGPRLKITIGHPLLKTMETHSPVAAASSPRFTTTDALIDTGAQRTILAPEAVLKVGLSKVDETKLIRVGGEIPANVYVASLQFPHSGLSAIEVIEVPCCELPHPLFRCLIGRDVLSRWVLHYDGPAGTWYIDEGAVSSWVEPPEGVDPNLWGG